MQHLKESGLFGKGLFEINSQSVISLYNDCLVAIGKEPTKRSIINIDGRGWSPELAEDFNDPYYLSNGDANPYAIIVSPSQRGLPVYYPNHSFDRDLLEALFSTASEQIADLTSQTALWIDMDQRFDEYTTIQDLLMISSVVVRVYSIGDLMGAARQQKKLVHKLRQGLNWMNAGLRDELQISGKKYGDLRYRSLEIDDLPYMKVSSFYTQAFGGVYIFRGNLRKSGSLMVLESVHEDFDSDKDVLHIEDTQEVLKRLREEGLLEFDLERFKKKPEILVRIRQTILDHVICCHESSNDSFDVTVLSDARRDQYARVLGDDLPHLYREIQKLYNRIMDGDEIDEEKIPRDLKLALLRPVVRPEEDPALYNLLMSLLVTLVWSPCELVYAFNKPYFFTQYLSWSETRRKHAINLVKKYRLKRAK